MRLFLHILVFISLSACAQADLRDFWTDDKIYDSNLSHQQQLKQRVFKQTDKISIFINDQPTDQIIAIENSAVINVTVKLDIDQVDKLEITDVLFESVKGFAPEGTRFPTKLALYKFDAAANIKEVTTRFKKIHTLQLKGYNYSEMVLLVKIKTADGKLFYTVQRIKVHL